MIYYDKKAHNVNDCGLKQQEALQAISLCSKRPPAQIKAPLIRAVLFATQVYKPGSVLTAIYLVPQLLTGSSHLLGTAGQAMCPSTVLLRDRVYIVKPMLPWAGWALTPPFHPCSGGSRSGISLLHLSWGHPRRALPVILALWSPDFPHLVLFSIQQRLSNLVADLL